MADVAITEADVQPGSSQPTVTGVAGEDITAGQLLYKDANDNGELKLAQHDGSLAEAELVGVALHTAKSGQPITYQTSGNYTCGGTVVAGTTYVASATPGGLAPQADAGTGDYVSVLGVAISTTVILINITNSQATIA